MSERLGTASPFRGGKPCSDGYTASFAFPEHRAIQATIREIERFVVATGTTSIDREGLVATLADWYGVHPRLFRSMSLEQLTDAWIAMREPRDPCD